MADPVKAVLVDTGALVALFDPDDDWHARAAAALAKLNTGTRLVTTLAIVTETTHLLDFDLRNQLAFLDWLVEGGADVRHLNPGDLAACRARMAQYADRPMDFADATLVRLAELDGLVHVLSVDADFAVYRAGRKKFVNLLHA